MSPSAIEVGTVPCRQCGKPHNLRALKGGKVSWAMFGHNYVPMSAEEVVELYEYRLAAISAMCDKRSSWPKPAASG